jgi:hypothetical protein
MAATEKVVAGVGSVDKVVVTASGSVMVDVPSGSELTLAMAKPLVVSHHCFVVEVVDVGRVTLKAVSVEVEEGVPDGKLMITDELEAEADAETDPESVCDAEMEMGIEPLALTPEPLALTLMGSEPEALTLMAEPEALTGSLKMLDKMLERIPESDWDTGAELMGDDETGGSVI